MHLNQKDYRRFQDQTLPTDDMIAFLEHLEQCDFCMEQFIQQEETQPIHTPAYLKEQIRNRAASPDIQMTKAVTATSVKMQLLYHSLQTAAGVVLALLLLFSIGRIDFTTLPKQPCAQEVQVPQEVSPPRKNYLRELSQSIGERLNHGTWAFTDYLNDFSNKITYGGNKK